MIKNYSFEDSNKFFFNNHRINITVNSGEIYNIAAEENEKNIYLPKCLKKIFWEKVCLFDSEGNQKTFWINRNSLAKRTHTSSSLVNYSLKRNKDYNGDFNAAIRILNKADRIATAMKKDSKSAFKKASEIVKILEKNHDSYLKKATTEGTFLLKKNGHLFIVRTDPKDPAKLNFYIKLSKVIGKGGFKNVYPLLDYEKEKANYALSVQSLDPKKPSKMKYPFIGTRIMQTLKDSKYTLNAEIYLEKGIERTNEGFLKLNKNAVSYLVTKRYEGTFSRLVSSNQFTLNEKLHLFTHILIGVSEMHAKQIVHCDLKNQNILFKKKGDRVKIKIIDFDLSKTFNERMTDSASPGTPKYLAPEAHAHSKIEYPDKLDSWSLGIMLYQLCEGTPAFFSELPKASKEDREEIVQTWATNLNFKHFPDQENLLRKIMMGLLEIEPSKRMSVEEALGTLQIYLNNQLKS